MTQKETHFHVPHSKAEIKKTFTKSIGHRYKSKLGDRVGEAARICNATLPLRGLASGGREGRQGYVGCIVYFEAYILKRYIEDV